MTVRILFSSRDALADEAQVPLCDATRSGIGSRYDEFDPQLPAAMPYRELIPAPPLSRYVDRFWYCEGMVPAHPLERVMPSGSSSAIFALSKDWLSVPVPGPSTRIARGSPSVVVAARTEYETIATADLARLAGIHFHPWGYRAFFDAPADALGDADVPLEFLWGREARELRQRLLEAPDSEAVFALLEAALLSRLRVPASLRILPYLTGHLGGSRRAPALNELAKQAGCSVRQLNRIFLSHVGLTPKRFHRVRRFRRALDAAARGSDSWVEVALDCGYADQSHFIRDFRSFSGVNPTAYFERTGQWTGHLALGENQAGGNERG